MKKNQKTVLDVVVGLSIVQDVKSYLTILLLLLLSLSSCGNKGNYSETSNELIDTLWNDKIQNVFFNVPFGASKEEVISKFADHGFLLMKKYSNESVLKFNYSEGQYFTFGGLNWEMLNVGLVNGKFYTIQFMNYSEDKASALSNFDVIKNTLSKKYRLNDKTPTDTTVYAISIGFGRDNRRVGMSCFRYETVNKEIKIGVDLGYMDERSFDIVSDEL